MNDKKDGLYALILFACVFPCVWLGMALFRGHPLSAGLAVIGLWLVAFNIVVSHRLDHSFEYALRGPYFMGGLACLALAILVCLVA